MVSRRGFIRVGAATVGSLALRPFGLIPTLAQSGPDYRALVCVFLFGGNDSNNTVIPMDSYSAYQSIRGSLALTSSELTAPITSAGRAAHFISRQARRDREPVFKQGAFRRRQCRLAGAASDTRPVSKPAGPDSVESFFAFRSAARLADCHRARSQPHRMGRARGGLYRVPEDQLLQLSGFLLRSRQRAGRKRRTDTAGGAGARTIAAVGRTFRGRKRAHQLAHYRKWRLSGAGRERHLVAQHLRCIGVVGRARQIDSAEDAVPHHQHRVAVEASGADHPGAIVSGHAASDLFLLAGRLRYARRRAAKRITISTRN